MIKEQRSAIIPLECRMLFFNTWQPRKISLTKYPFHAFYRQYFKVYNSLNRSQEAVQLNNGHAELH